MWVQSNVILVSITQTQFLTHWTINLTLKPTLQTWGTNFCNYDSMNYNYNLTGNTFEDNLNQIWNIKNDENGNDYDSLRNESTK